MFMFLSLLAASADGFISGFVMGTLGTKLKLKDNFLSFSIIFTCCMAASTAGKLLAQTSLAKYINMLGVAIMLLLAYTAFTEKTAKIPSSGRTAAISLSVAADASIVCLYLAMCGYNIFTLSAISAFLHCLLMAIGAKISNKITERHNFFYARYIRSAFFAIMALWKLVNI
ncbi:MAG: hypothetical protein IKK99_09600 [Oscillospiraceae bacterium]|nr:hypothetical protein [Oscillospiraceae bacterium]